MPSMWAQDVPHLLWQGCSCNVGMDGVLSLRLAGTGTVATEVNRAFSEGHTQALADFQWSTKVAPRISKIGWISSQSGASQRGLTNCLLL